ncbi:MAG: CCA tRNA nucleotidyltransferase [Nitrospirae bacterium]|nr:CCA tRNA nucleotidyltransferase [Nitrospirota bacterium]
MVSLSALPYLSIIISLKIIEKIYLGMNRSGSYLVGGSVRDILLRRPLRDIDISVPSDSLEIAKRFADKIKGSFFVMSEEEGVARVVKKEGRKALQFDFARFKGKDILEDLSNRDFTINAMAINISKFRISDFGFRISSIEIIDPYNGRKDLNDKIIRVIKPDALKDDPLRMLRAIRLASDLELKIEDKTIEYIKGLAPSLGSVSSERVRDELFRIFKSNRSHYYISLLDEYRLLDVIIPEIREMKGLKQGSYHVYELWTHSLKTVEYLEDVIKNIKLYLPEYTDRIKRHLRLEIEQGIDRLSLLKFAALLHDTGKPSTIKTECAQDYRKPYEAIVSYTVI